MGTGFALTALVAMLLNLTLADEIEDTLVVKVEQIDSDVTDSDVSKDQLAVQKVLEV